MGRAADETLAQRYALSLGITRTGVASHPIDVGHLVHLRITGGVADTGLVQLSDLLVDHAERGGLALLPLDIVRADDKSVLGQRVGPR
jgi:hypothetical protein